VLLALAAPASAAEKCPSPCTGCDAPGRIHTLDLSLRRGDTPEVVRGSVTLALVKLNKVRYDVAVGQQVTITDGPDLSLAGLIPDFSAAVPEVAAAAEGSAPEVAAAVAGVAAAPTPAERSAASERLEQAAANIVCPPTTGELDDQIKAIGHCLGVEAGRVANLLASAKDSRARLHGRSKSVGELVAQSDQTLLAEKGGELLAASVKAELGVIAADLADAQALWPNPRQVAHRRAAIEELAKALADLPIEPIPQRLEHWSDWIKKTPNYIRYRELQADAQKLLDALKALDKDSEIDKAYHDLVAKLKAWQALLNGLGDPKAYAICIPVRCGYPFFKETTFDYTLTLVDRTVEDKTKNKTTEKLAQVVCPSNVTVSGGITLAHITERDFGFVASLPDPPATEPANGDGGDVEEPPPALVNRIGIKNQGEEQINPAVLISTRLHSFDDAGAYGLHLTAGSMADFDNPDGGLQFGYLLGVTVSFKDNFLLTGGYAASRVPELAGGFSVGDVQPPGLDEVPVTKEWEFDWVVGVTYKLGGG
jgi:hypothetical protein